MYNNHQRNLIGIKERQALGMKAGYAQGQTGITHVVYEDLDGLDQLHDEDLVEVS